MRGTTMPMVGLSLLLGWLSVAATAAAMQEPKEPKEGQRKGTVVGVVTAKGENWIEVKADGEEKARRYVPHWRGGAPAQGGGPDKAMVAQIRATPVGSRVRLEWEFEERPRVVKLELLKKAGEQPKDKSKEHSVSEPQRSGTVTGVIRSKKDQGKNVVLEVQAPGEEKARPYFVQFDPKVQGPIPEVLQAVRAAPVGSQVHLEWVATGHGPAIVRFQVLRTVTGEKK